MKSPGHEMILASAGSGKTYALTNRYVQLLALGAAPERIVALTFTRKAAGEFFDEILTKLARAAGEPLAARKLAGQLGLAHLRDEDFRALLRRVIDAMPRLALGTFDAFFARIVRSFPLELGLGGDFTLLEEYAAQFERRRVLRHLFAHSGREPDTAQREFIESFKRATFGREEKQLAGLLDEYIDEHQRSYRQAADAILWGDPERIWPGGCVWLDQISGRSAALIVRTWATSASLTAGQRQRWFDFLDAFATWAPGLNPSRPLEYMLQKVLDAWSELGQGDVPLVIDRRKVIVPAEVGAALRDITREIFSGEFTRRLEGTRGLFGILARYDAAYETLVRRAGRLTFADIERLLADHELIPPAQTKDPAPGTAETEDQQTLLALDFAPIEANLTLDRRLLLDWRLDAKFDHWLLDEFQDTSRTQWHVLENLIDEAIQDASQSRTFFCVGDVKQAIYGWRGGDARLFGEIIERYNAGPQPAIRLTPMDASYRSGEAVLDLVNRVFGDPGALRDLSGGAGERWSKNWRPHTSAVPGNIGQAAWLFAEEAEERFARTREILEQIRPLERGLTVAVLTQKNRTATELADYLRRAAGMPAIAEADLRVCADNPATAALLALIKVAAHPGDSLAWQHVGMSPLAAALRTAGLESRDALTRRILYQIHHDGFEATVTSWWRQLEPALAADDTFTSGRGRQLVEAARQFDETDSRDIAEFLQFAERHVVRDAETVGVVRVMTIHKAKGLGFDVVIVPDLEGKRLATRRDGLAIHTVGGTQVEWVLDLPTTFFREYDRVLAEHVELEETDACYEKLALLYVALTRAKRALYVVSSPGGSESRNLPRLLASTLESGITEVTVGEASFPGGFSSGDPQWFANIRAAERTVTSRELSTLAPEVAVPVARHVARTPSAQRTGRLEGALLFGLNRAGAATFGIAVHAALSAVSWWDPAESDAWLHTVRQLGLPEDAITAARACLDAPALASVFRPPAESSTIVWRERQFELVHEGVWITGRFDRVLIEHDAQGAVTRVRVIDFKTDQTGETAVQWRKTADHFRPQVAWYRRAAARLARVPEARVHCEIVLTTARDVQGQPPGPLELA